MSCERLPRYAGVGETYHEAATDAICGFAVTPVPYNKYNENDFQELCRASPNPSVTVCSRHYAKQRREARADYAADAAITAKILLRHPAGSRSRTLPVPCGPKCYR